MTTAQNREECLTWGVPAGPLLPARRGGYYSGAKALHKPEAAPHTAVAHALAEEWEAIALLVEGLGAKTRAGLIRAAAACQAAARVDSAAFLQAEGILLTTGTTLPS